MRRSTAARPVFGWGVLFSILFLAAATARAQDDFLQSPLPPDVNPYKKKARRWLALDVEPGARIGHSRFISHVRNTQSDPIFESTYNFDGSGVALNVDAQVYVQEWFGVDLFASLGRMSGDGTESSNSPTAAQTFPVLPGYSPLSAIAGASNQAVATESETSVSGSDTALHADLWLRAYPWKTSGPTELDVFAGVVSYREDWRVKRLRVKQVAVETPAGSGVFLPAATEAKLPGLRSKWETTWIAPQLGIRARFPLVEDVLRCSFSLAAVGPPRFNADGTWNLQSVDFSQDTSSGFGLEYKLRLNMDITKSIRLGVGVTGATLRARGGTEKRKLNGAPLAQQTRMRKVSSTRNTITLNLSMAF